MTVRIVSSVFGVLLFWDVLDVPLFYFVLPPAILYQNGSGPFVVYSYLLDIYRARKYDVNIHGKYIHRAKKIFQNIEILIQRIRLNLFKYDRFIEQLVGYSLLILYVTHLRYITGY